MIYIFYDFHLSSHRDIKTRFCLNPENINVYIFRVYKFKETIGKFDHHARIRPSLAGMIVNPPPVWLHSKTSNFELILSFDIKYKNLCINYCVVVITEGVCLSAVDLFPCKYSLWGGL